VKYGGKLDRANGVVGNADRRDGDVFGCNEGEEGRRGKKEGGRGKGEWEKKWKEERDFAGEDGGELSENSDDSGCVFFLTCQIEGWKSRDHVPYSGAGGLIAKGSGLTPSWRQFWYDRVIGGVPVSKPFGRMPKGESFGSKFDLGPV